MKTKREFRDEYGPSTSGIPNSTSMWRDAIAVMDALEAQIPPVNFNVGDRVKTLQDGLHRTIKGVTVKVYYRLSDSEALWTEGEFNVAPTMPTVEEFYDTFDFVSGNGADAVYDAMEKLCERYKAAKESRP